MKVLVITDYKGLIRQGLKTYEGINLNILKEELEKSRFEVRVLSFNEIINSEEKFENYFVIYTSAQNYTYKSYIDDLIYEINKKNFILPKYEILKCHENKSYQEMYKKSIGLRSLKSWDFCNMNDLKIYDHLIKFPIILKLLDGAGSRNVFKVNNIKEIEKIIKKKIFIDENKIFNMKKYLKKYIFKFKYDKEFYEDYSETKRFILQEYIPNLKEDWKVLVFGDKYYVLNRKIRKNDFRASGSGKLTYKNPPIEVLNYAKQCFDKLDSPMLSLDICINENKECFLIEFQGIHFGPYTIINAEHYYILKDKKWEMVVEKSDFSKEYAKSLIRYINKKGEKVCEKNNDNRS